MAWVVPAAVVGIALSAWAVPVWMARPTPGYRHAYEFRDATDAGWRERRAAAMLRTAARRDEWIAGRARALDHERAGWRTLPAEQIAALFVHKE